MRRIPQCMLWAAFLAAGYLISSGSVSVAQALPTATADIRLSAFGGITGNFTDVFGGHNLAVTVGGDVTYHRLLFGMNPSVEVRGMIPFDAGDVAGLESIVGGVKFERQFGALHPYGDVLLGRGAINWQHGGFPSGNVILLRTVTPVFSPGVGVDVDVTHKWTAKFDFQYQFWTEFPPAPGTPNPKVLTGAVMYRFDFNHRY